MAFHSHLLFYLECLLSLAQDEWPDVAYCARSWLNSLQSQPRSIPIHTETQDFNVTSSAPHPMHPLLLLASHALPDWIEDLPQRLSCSNDAGRVHALKIATCIEILPPQCIFHEVYGNSTALTRVLTVLSNAMMFDVDVLRLLMTAPAAAYTYVSYAPLVKSDPGKQDSSSSSSSSSTATATAAMGSSLTESIPDVPCMPAGLHYITSRSTYNAVVHAIRSLAMAAVHADNDPTTTTTATPDAHHQGRDALVVGIAMQSLIDCCMQSIQGTIQHGLIQQDRYKNNTSVHHDKRNETKNTRRISPQQQQQRHHTENMSMRQDSEDDTKAVPWQLAAAQLVLVVQEILFGSSSSSTSSSRSVCAHDTRADAGGTTCETAEVEVLGDEQMEQVVASIIHTFVDDRIWNLPVALSSQTHRDRHLALPHSTATAAPATSALVVDSNSTAGRACNAVLQRTMLHCIGTCARAVGPRCARNGRILRAILIPLFEKVADPCPLVSVPALTALHCIVYYCGYSNTEHGNNLEQGMRRLVTENSDYIIDGLCLQLRRPDKHPRAPQLFAALLKEGGVAPGLIPLLAEPARRALQGTSIIARSRRPEDVLPFVLSLKEMAKGGSVVAKEACMEMEQHAKHFALDRTHGGRQDVGNEDASPSSESESDGDGHEGKKCIDKISKYFENARHQTRQRTDDGALPLPGSISPSSSVSVSPPVSSTTIRTKTGNKKRMVSQDEWDALQILKKKVIATGLLLKSTLDSASILVVSSHLPVAVQSCATCTDALHALSIITTSLDLYKNEIEPEISPPGGLQVLSDPIVPTFLPSIHLLWTPLIAALDDWRISVVESALCMLRDVVMLSGSFLARRFEKDAWPRLSALLIRGPSHPKRKMIVPGQDDISTPVVLQRAQRGVLECLHAIASTPAKDEAAGGSVLSPGVLTTVLSAVSSLLNEGSSTERGIRTSVSSAKHAVIAPIVREAATNCFVALATLDPDAAWSLLISALKCMAVPSNAFVVPRSGTNAQVPFSAAADGLDIPSMSSLSPVPSTTRDPHKIPPLDRFDGSGYNALPDGLLGCNEAKLRAMLLRIDSFDVPWHKKVQLI